jgi:hypothetical protein
MKWRDIQLLASVRVNVEVHIDFSRSSRIREIPYLIADCEKVNDVLLVALFSTQIYFWLTGGIETGDQIAHGDGACDCYCRGQGCSRK